MHTEGLKFSVRAYWVPLYINRKLLAGRIIPLHRLEEKLFETLDDRGRETLQTLYYSNSGFHAEQADKKLSAMEFLKKNHILAHAFFITYDRITLLLGYNTFHHRLTDLNPHTGIHIDYFTAVPLNYPGNIKPSYIGKFHGDDTYYRVRGIGHATIALACYYAEDMHPKQKPDSIAVDLTARSDEKLIQGMYVKKYGFDFHKGRRGKDNDLFLNFEKSRAILKKYEQSYKSLDRPEGNGLTFKDPLKY